MSTVVNPMVMGLGTTELLIILGVLILLFGAKKLPELARGSGRALRIFKSETKGLMDDDDQAKDDQTQADQTKAGETKAGEQKQIDAQRSTPAATPMESPVETPVEPRRPETDR